MGILGAYQTSEFQYDDELVEVDGDAFDVRPYDFGLCEETYSALRPVLVTGSMALDLPIANRCSS